MVGCIMGTETKQKRENYTEESERKLQKGGGGMGMEGIRESGGLGRS